MPFARGRHNHNEGKDGADTPTGSAALDENEKIRMLLGPASVMVSAFARCTYPDQ